MTEKTLLPIDLVLNHDGHDLKIVRRLSSGLTGEVYEGKLSLVEGEPPIKVAIKVMKALEFPMARQFFLQESETLAFLMHLEEEASKEQRVSLKVAPVYYGRGEYEGTPYLVMEFIPGKEVPALLEKEGHFSEMQALAIAWHLYRTLDILHIRLKRTFIDLKFENLWWVSGGTEWGGQLKLTDFGTLEEIKPTETQMRGVRRDLLLGGVYLFAMLTGYTLNYSLGELKERAEPVIRDREAGISWGTRKLLRRLLHRNPASRPTAAAVVASELRTIVNFWGQPEERLFAIAQNNLAEAETAAEEAKAQNQPLNQQGREYATRARAALDILQRRFPQRDISNDVLRADAVLSIGDYLERGTALLKGRSYAMARQVFEEGIQWSDDPAHLRHWAFLARVGEEVSPSIFEAQYEEAVKALDSLMAGHWEMAKTRLEQLTPALTSKGLDYLKFEADFFALLEQAEAMRASGEYGKAAKIYQQALNIFKQLPEIDAKFIRDEEVGDLSISIEEMKALASTRERAHKLFTEAYHVLQQGDLEKASSQAWEAYLADRSAPFRTRALCDIAKGALERAAKEKEKFVLAIQTAQQVAGIGLWETPIDPALAVIWHLALNMNEADKAIALRDGLEFHRVLEQAHSEAANEPLLLPLTHCLLDNAVERAEKSGDHSLLRVAADLEEKLLGNAAAANAKRTQAEAMEAKQIEERRIDIDQRVERIRFILAPISPQPENLTRILAQAAESASVWRGMDLAVLRDRLRRLEETGRRLDEVKILIQQDKYRAEEISQLQETVANGLLDARKAIEGQERADTELLNKRIAALSVERTQIDALRHWITRAPEVHANLDAQRSIHVQLREKLGEFIYRCYLVLAGNRESDREAIAREQAMKDYGKAPYKVDGLGAVKVFVEWGQRALDELGPEAWKEVVQIAEQHQRQSEAEFESAEVALKTGDMARLAAELDRLESSYSTNLRWQFLKKGLVQVSAWKAWLEMQAERFEKGQPDIALLLDLRDYLRVGLPEMYWEKSPATNYLKKASEVARQCVSQSLKRHDDVDFIEKLREWLSVEWTSRLASSLTIEKQGIKWNGKQWLREIYQARHNLDQIAALVSSAAIPENIENALYSFDVTDWQNIRTEEKRKEQVASTLKRVLIIASAMVVVIGLLFTGGFFAYRANKDAVQQLLHGTHTPTLTPSLTVTPTPTLTPTPTDTPTPTLTPSPIPPSQFSIDATGLYPALPIAGDNVWVLNEQDAMINPPLTENTIWKKDYLAVHEKYYYTEVGDATVAWEMDQPFDAGLYQIYILDTRYNSTGPYQFSVSLNGNPVTPYRGENSVIFRNVGQRTDDWLSLGAFEVLQGQKLSVQVNVPPLDAKTPFAVDRLLIVKVSDAQRGMLDNLPDGRTLASLLDDDGAIFYEVWNEAPTQVQDRGLRMADTLAWNGSFASRNQANPIAAPIWVEWQPIGRLPAGTYELYVWVPALHATIVADYALLADGVLVPRDNPAQINQRDYEGQWVSLGIWKLDADAAVGVRMIIPAGTVGDIGVDAVALVRVGD